ncbi:cytochrome oxidase small assembly protein [Advenella sp. RU8]
MTPEQRSRNIRAGLILAAVVVVLFLWTIGKGLKIV